MADDPNTPVGRMVFHQAALATLGADAAWDRAVLAFIKADVLQHADLEFGAAAKHQAKDYRARIGLESRYGKEWRLNPAAQALRDQIYDEAIAADDAWTRDYCAPFWQAGRELALTPAPTMAAAVFKANVIEKAEIWNDSAFPRDAMEIVIEEMTRLCEGSA